MTQQLITARMPIRGTDCRLTVYYRDGRPVEIYAEPVEQPYHLGDVYLGKIEKIDPDIPAAYVLFTPGQRGYLPLSPSDDCKAGDEIAVQIITEAQKTKLPRLSKSISFTGQFVVVSEERPGFSFSKKLSSEKRDVLNTVFSDLKESNAHILFRTAAGSAVPVGSPSTEEQKSNDTFCAAMTEQKCRAEAESFLKTIRSIREVCHTRTCYSVLYQAPSLQEDLLRSYAAYGWERVQTDDPSIVSSLEQICSEIDCPIEFYEDPMLALYHLHDFSALVDHCLRKEVPLTSGGSLIIEETEAFVCIDVNTGKASGRKQASSLKSRINLEAAEEAARQIRLRQLSGTILIDFINADENDEKDLGECLEKLFAQDPVTTRLVDFTKLHICEITRRKTHRSFREQVASLCGN